MPEAENMAPQRATQASSPPAPDDSRGLHELHSGRRAAPQHSHRFHSLPTKEGFKILISEVKEACRSEIKTLQADFHHLATQVEDLEEDLQTTKLAVHRVRSQQTIALCL